MNKTEQIKSLKNGNGIQYLLDEGYRILKNPINTFDTDYNLIAYTDVFLDDRFWIELTTTGTFSLESQMFFMNECFTDDVANAEKLALMKSDKLKYDRILGHIFNGKGVKVANVLMIESNEAFDPDTVAAFDILADLLTNEISKDEFYIAYGEKWQNTMINKLINRELEEKKLYSPHLQSLYFGLKANLYLAVVDIAKSSLVQNEPKYFMDILRQKRSDFKYAIYGDYIVMIISTDYRAFNIKRELSGLVEYLEQENLYTGVSSCFDNLFELNKYYNEAVEALKGLKHKGSTFVVKYRKV